MKTDIFEADPFGGGRGAHLASLESDYRFEVRDEFFLTTGGKRAKYRITHVRIDIDQGRVAREILALRL